MEGALIEAVETSNESEVTRLIKAGVDVNETDDHGKTAVFYANRNHNMGILCELIKCGAEFNLDEIDGKGALFYAAEMGITQVVDKLNRSGLDLDITDDEGDTAVCYADRYENIDVLCELIKYGADFELEIIDVESTLCYAAENNLTEVVRQLYFAGLDLDTSDEEGETAVFYANRNKSMDVLCELIKCGAEFELDEIDGKSALFYAVQISLVEVVRKLRDAGFDLNITDGEGKTALFCANRNKSMDVLCELIECGAEFKLDKIDGKSALFYAAESNNTEVVRKLHDAGLDLNITDDEGRTALFYADRSNSMKLLCMLIECGACIKLNEIDGKSTLFYAAKYNLTGVVKKLHSAGLDLNITDDEGKTPLFYATEKEVIDLLIDDYKLFVNARDQYGRTPLFHTVERTNSRDTVRHLIEKGGNLHLKDYCNVSIFSLLVRKSITSVLSLEDVASNFLLEKRERKSLTAAIFDMIYSQAPLLTLRAANFFEPFTIFEIIGVLEVLNFALQQDFIQESDKEKIQCIKCMIFDHKIDVPSILDLLNMLGANPNAVDVDGNTALHYATILPFLGVYQETVMDICGKLRDLGSNFKLKNHDDETPLLFCLSSKGKNLFIRELIQWKGIKDLAQLCRFLLANGSNVNETSQSEGSVFHLVIDLVKQGLELNGEASRQVALHQAIELLELFSSFALEKREEKIVNIGDGNLNSPLHLWASLTLPSSEDYTSPLTNHHTFGEILKVMLKIFRKCGAKPNLRNEKEETPLHLCKTWSAVKLLIDYGAKPSDMDSSDCSPLLAIAKAKTYVQNPDRLYPDVADDPKTFWKNVTDKGLDPWTANKQAESVLGVLMKSENYSLAKSLVEVTCEMNPASGTKLDLLHIICKDESKRIHWKTNLVEMILNSARKPRISVDSALFLCCTNIVQFGMFDYIPKENGGRLQQKTNMITTSDNEQQPSKKRRMKDENSNSNGNPGTHDSVHCKIAKQLLFYKDGNTVPESCLDIARENPALKHLLTTPVDINGIPSLIPWTSVSEK